MRQQLGADLTWEWSQCRQKCFMLLLKVSTVIQFSDNAMTVIHFLCEKNPTKILSIVFIKLFSYNIESWTVNCANTTEMDYFLVQNHFKINGFIRFDKGWMSLAVLYSRRLIQSLMNQNVWLSSVSQNPESGFTF